MENAKILIVDDDADLTEAIQAILQSRQYVVVTASDRQGGIDMAVSEKPDLIILDVMMDTWQDGFDISRELKKDPEFKNTPILMLTGIKNKTGIDFKSSAGDPKWLPVESFLDKPVDSDELLAEVEKLLSQRE